MITISDITKIAEEYNETLWISLSGGVDSMVLLDLAYKAKLNNKLLSIKAIHVNHNISEHSKSWASFCEEQCQLRGIPLVVEHVYIKDSKRNFEKKARDLRYQAIQKHVGKCPLVLGHHNDDRIEGFFLSLLKGSGLRGLTSLTKARRVQSTLRVRPLLDYHKDEIVRHAKNNDIEWITDDSNTDNSIERNFIRNVVLKHLEERFPSFSQRIKTTLSNLMESQAIIEDVMAEELNKYTKKGVGDYPVLLNTNFTTRPDHWHATLILSWLTKIGSPVVRRSTISSLVAISASTSKSGNDLVVAEGLYIRKWKGYLLNWDEEKILQHLTRRHENLDSVLSKECFDKKAEKKIKNYAPRWMWPALPCKKTAKLIIFANPIGEIISININ